MIISRDKHFFSIALFRSIQAISVLFCFQLLIYSCYQPQKRFLVDPARDTRINVPGAVVFIPAGSTDSKFELIAEVVSSPSPEMMYDVEVITNIYGFSGYEGRQFSKPVKIAFTSRKVREGVDIQPVYWDGGQWVTVDYEIKNNIIIAETDHLSFWTLIRREIRDTISHVSTWGHGHDPLKTSSQSILPTITYDGITLEVYPEDFEDKVPWGPDIKIKLATSTEDGQANTSRIVSGIGNHNSGNYAANICKQLNAFDHSDWYLPACYELQQLYQHRNQVGGFEPAYYWSSTDDSWGGEVWAIHFGSGTQLYQPKYKSNKVRCIRLKSYKAPAEDRVTTSNALVASRYAVKSDGSQGLIFGAQFLSYFTISTVAMVYEASYNKLVEGIATEIMKDIGIKAAINNLPGMNEPEIGYISFCFPIQSDLGTVEIKDLIILHEYKKDKDLVPLGVPVQLEYYPDYQEASAPVLAIKKSYRAYQVDNQGTYPLMTVSEIGYKSGSTLAKNFHFQTYGVVDGYLRHENNMYLIIKEYSNYHFQFMQRTALGFVAVDVNNHSQLPAPGSVIHFWGKTENIKRGFRIKLPHYSWENVRNAKYMDMHGHYLLAGYYLPIGQVKTGTSVFTIGTVPEYWDAVTVDLDYDVDSDLTEESAITESSITGIFTDPRDGQTYQWVKIGDQVWMAKNLNYVTESGSWCYENNPGQCNVYGHLYDWNTALAACPPGWHLPSDQEWAMLIDYLGGEVIAGGKMKESGTTHWEYPNQDATNSSGFSALPDGTRDPAGQFGLIGYSGGWWSSTEYSDSDASYLTVVHYNGSVRKYVDKKSYGRSLRCLRVN